LVNINYHFLVITCQAQLLDGHSRALKMQIFTLFILKENTNESPLEPFS